MENASRAFLDAVRKSMRQIRIVIGATTIDPKLLTAAERLQYEGYLRREETNAAILALSKSGIPIKQIVRQTGHSRKLVRQVIRGECTGKVRWTCICYGSRISGRPAVATALTSGAAYQRVASEARSASSANGRPVGGGPRRPTRETFRGSRRHEPSRA